MNASPARAATAMTAEARTVPRQADPPGGPLRAPDPLEHSDARAAADAAAVENLLRCWVRECDMPSPVEGQLSVPLPASGTALLVPVRYWSPTGWHRFGPPRLEGGTTGAPTADAVTVAALLSRECVPSGPAPAGPVSGNGRSNGDAGGTVTVTVAEADADTGAVQESRSDAGGGDEGVGEDRMSHGGGWDSAELVARVADSVRRTAVFVADRRERPAALPGGDLFLEAEQSLVLGHPLHPTPKSREGLSDAEVGAYSPELRGSFPLHWLAVDRQLLDADSAWTERGRTVSAERLALRLAGPGLPLPDGAVPLPLHPWQARELRSRPAAAALFDEGLLRDLGPYGDPWHPTSSVRTVYRPGAPAMLKLSLGLRITNSRRENLRKELLRGVEVHRLLRSGLAEEWRSACPSFDIVRDPAWLAVSGPDGHPLPGADVMIRHNPFGQRDDVVCVAGLVSPRPWPGTTVSGGPGIRSRLAHLVGRLALRTGRPTGAVATEWFLRYLRAVVRPVLWLDGAAGVALEAHQQNTLVLLDDDGWPSGGRYRDNQGYYFRESRRAELDRRLPGIGNDSDTFVPDEVTDERFAYYLGVNNVLGLIGAFGSQHLADERVLLAAFRRFLGEAASGPGRLGSPLPARLLGSAALRCKANLLTRLHGLDELEGPVDTQSVYVTIANPVAV